MPKVARTKISKEYLESMLRADFWAHPNTVVTSNAPKDLEILGLAYSKDFPENPYVLEVYVKSESFDDVPEGQEPPLIEPFYYTQNTMESI